MPRSFQKGVVVMTMMSRAAYNDEQGHFIVDDLMTLIHGTGCCAADRWALEDAETLPAAER